MKLRDFVEYLVQKLTEEHYADLESNIVRQIRSRMTENEIRAQRRRDKIVGPLCIVLLLLPFAILVARQWISAAIPGGAWTLFALLLITYAITFYAIRRRNKRALASTTWAKQQGIRAEDIVFWE